MFRSIVLFVLLAALSLSALSASGLTPVALGLGGLAALAVVVRRQ